MGFAANYLGNMLSTALGRAPRNPLLFSYYVTHRCTLRCKFCSDGGGKPFKDDHCNELDTNGAKKLLNIISTAADTIDFTGGEPLLREDLTEILRHAKQLKLRAVLNTRGIGLYAQKEVLEYCDMVVLGLDALDEKTIGGITGGGEETGRECLAALELIRKRGNKLVLSVVAMPDTLGKTTEILEFALKHKIAFQLSPQLVGKKVHPALHNNPEYISLIERLIAAKKSGAPILGIMPYLQNLRSFEPFDCYPQLMPCIRPDGNMYHPCVEFKTAPVNLLDYPTYKEAVKTLKAPNCKESCQIFCHMALSLLQQHPVMALQEGETL